MGAGAPMRDSDGHIIASRFGFFNSVNNNNNLYDFTMHSN